MTNHWLANKLEALKDKLIEKNGELIALKATRELCPLTFMDNYANLSIEISNLEREIKSLER